MIQVIITAIVVYAATASDLIVLLLMFFARAHTKKQYRDIYIGQLLGSLALIVISLFLAYVLNFIPDKWILGLLGLVPLYFGFKIALFGDDEEEEIEEQLDRKGFSQLARTVAMVTIASCGADNIGLFTPYFMTLDMSDLIVTLVVFVILMFVLVWTAQRLSTVPGVSHVMGRFSRWIMAVVYIGLGAFIIYDNGTIQTLLL